MRISPLKKKVNTVEEKDVTKDCACSLLAGRRNTYAHLLNLSVSPFQNNLSELHEDDVSSVRIII